MSPVLKNYFTFSFFSINFITACCRGWYKTSFKIFPESVIEFFCKTVVTRWSLGMSIGARRNYFPKGKNLQFADCFCVSCGIKIKFENGKVSSLDRWSFSVNKFLLKSKSSLVISLRLVKFLPSLKFFE